MTQGQARHAFCPARVNPFRVDRTDQLPFRFETGDWSDHLQRLRQLNYRGAIVGPEGSGKTTLLTDLAERIAVIGLIPLSHRADPKHPDDLAWLSSESRASPAKQIILVDSAESLSRSAWSRLLNESKRFAGLVVAVHRDCALPTWMSCSPSWAMLQILLSDLDLAGDRDHIGSAAQQLLAKHRGNIRSVFRELFDRYADGRLT